MALDRLDWFEEHLAEYFKAYLESAPRMKRKTSGKLYVFVISLARLRFSKESFLATFNKRYISYVTYQLLHIMCYILYLTFVLKHISALFTDNINDIRRIYDQCNNVKTQKLRRKRQGSNLNHFKVKFRFRVKNFDSQTVEMFEKFVKSYPNHR